MTCLCTHRGEVEVLYNSCSLQPGTGRGWVVITTLWPLGGSQGPVWTARKFLPPPGFDPITVQIIASRHTDWAIPAATCTWRGLNSSRNEDSSLPELVLSSKPICIYSYCSSSRCLPSFDCEYLPTLVTRELQGLAFYNFRVFCDKIIIIIIKKPRRF